MGKNQLIKFHVQRYNPDLDDKPTFRTYKVPYTDRQGVLDALHYIFRNLDSSLAYRWNCRTGQCGACAISINGIPGLACRTVVDPSKDYVLKPLPNFPVIRDLVVDLGPGFKRLEKLRPYLERTSASDRPEKLTREETSAAMEMRSCIECFACYAACPAVASAKQEYPGPMAMRELASFEFDPRDEGDRVQLAVSSGLYDCTSCGICKEVCIPKHIDIRRTAVEGLRALAVERELGPLDGHQGFIDQIKETGYAVDVKTTPLTELLPAVVDVPNPVDEVLFFPGCLINLRIQDAGLNLVEVLKRNNVRVHIPKDFVCCTSVAFRSGARSVAYDMVIRNTEYFRKLGVKKVVSLCPGCMSTIKQDWPIVLHEKNKPPYDFEPLDINEYLIKQFGVEGLNKKDLHPLPIRVVYHDPCHLNRHQGITEEPRQLIRMIPEIEFIDVEDSDRCCGAGGGVRAGRRELSYDIAEIKLDILSKPKPDVIATSCSFCYIQLVDEVKRENLDIKVMNVTDLLAASYRGDSIK
ncbi:MAG: fumarate reductase (CoM/CoB) subunit TfrB [Candidatus Thorarchaeota archaeon]